MRFFLLFNTPEKKLESLILFLIFFRPLTSEIAPENLTVKQKIKNWPSNVDLCLLCFGIKSQTNPESCDCIKKQHNNKTNTWFHIL